jgi:hypothetical protein
MRAAANTERARGFAHPAELGVEKYDWEALASELDACGSDVGDPLARHAARAFS